MSDSDTFWNWSVRRWDKAEFRNACMQWQQGGGEVNLLLFALWQGEQGLLWDEAYVAQLMTDTQYWRETLLAPLRELRAAIKGKLGPGVEYEQAKALELRLERRFQATLCAAAQPPAGIDERISGRKSSGRSRADQCNIELLCRFSDISPDAGWLETLFSR